ncbi:MAG TPA: 23S rRNA (adenine(2030)-N(6))-methyltransferase RlmJ [Candidatus Binatia bacterium]|nr:23S rRNA (adenine(2030)-N(6))-methyltransferase RlmJ [Candidatus Binatia bacterium]
MGDVWKHCVLVAVLDRVVAAGGRVGYLETHAGEGQYPLGPTGEWREGIGRLAAADDRGDDAAARYLRLCRRLAPGGDRAASYPGSPAFARAVLGPDAALTLWERDDGAHGRLVAHTRGDERVRVRCGDGLAALERDVRAAAARADALVVFVDPPWTRKVDWIEVPDALVAAVPAAARACFLLWYPVKSLTRPNAMISRLHAGGVPGTVVELVTTPLEQRRHRLNGSGVLLVRPPAGALEAIAAAAPTLGARCATEDGVWSSRMQAWRAG